MDNRKIDDFFKDKFQERSFEMKDEYWKDAEALIEKERKRKRRGWWFFWSIIGITIMGLTGAWWLSDSTTVMVPPLSQKEKKTENAVAYTTEATVRENATEQSDATKNEWSTNTNSTKPTTTTTANETQSTTPIATNTQTPKNQNQAVDAITKKSTAKTIDQNDQEQLSSPNTLLEDSVNSVDQQPAKKVDNSREGITNPSVTQEKNRTDESTVSENTVSENTVQQKSTTQAITIPSNQGEVNEAKLEITKNQKSEADKDLYQILNLERLSMLLKAPDRIRLVGADFELELLDEETTKSPFPGGRRLQFGLVGGGDWYAATDSSNATTAFHFGLTARYKLSRNWQIAADLLWNRRTGDFNTGLPMDTIRQIEYGFGKREDFYALTTSNIYTFELPISLQWKWKQHRLEGGFSLNYLLNTKVNLTFNRFLFPWERNEIGTRYEEGTTENFRSSESNYSSFYPAFHLGYQYDLGSHWQIGVRARFVPGKQSAEAGAKGLRFGLRYYF